MQGPQGDTGATGPQGPAGATWYAASGAPADSLGSDGDLYLNNATGDVYQRASGSWAHTADLSGPQGPKGDTGAAGAQGAKGDTGATGAQGPKGDTGATGATGPQGAKGDTGATGPAGTEGWGYGQGPAYGEATTSGWPADLATPGPSATVVVPASGKVLVTLSTLMSTDVSTDEIVMGISVDGTPLDQSYYGGLVWDGKSGYSSEGSWTRVLTLTPGTHTFGAKYGVYNTAAGTATASFSNRQIIVIPLP